MLAAGCAQLKTSQVSPGKVRGGDFAPGRPGVDAYGPAPAFTCRASGVLQLLKNDAPNAVEDGQLCVAAEALTGWDSSEPVPVPVLDFAAWTYGLPSPPRLRALVSTFKTEEPADIAPAFNDALVAFTQSAARPRFGVAVVRLAKGSTRVALVMQDMPVEVTAPRTLPAGATGRLKGRMLAPGETASVTWSDVQGRLQKGPQGSADFDVELKCEGSGRMVAELSGSKGTRLALPVWCGEAAPISVSLGGAETSAPEKAVLEAINGERSGAGLKPLEWDEPVSNAARAAAAALRDSNGAVADPSGFLKAAGASTALVVENPGQALDVNEAHRGFALSPALRANYMNPEVAQAGIGVAEGPLVNGRKSVFVVELFTRRPGKVDPAQVGEQLAARIAEKRAAAKAAALAKDATLEKAAQAYATALAASAGTLSDAEGNRLLAPLYKGYTSLNVLSGARADPMSVADEASITGKGAQVGIGVAQGDNASLGANTIYVVVLIGTRR